MKVTIPCEVLVDDQKFRFTVGGRVVFENCAHHLEQWQKSMVSATLKAFGEANAKLAEKVAR